VSSKVFDFVLLIDMGSRRGQSDFESDFDFIKCD
jgi:hypothetical protein